MMEGRLWLESEPGQGSRFYFVAQFGRQREDAMAGGSRTQALHDIRTLIVDDKRDEPADPLRDAGQLADGVVGRERRGGRPEGAARCGA
jgi:hypothetical protein